MVFDAELTESGDLARGVDNLYSAMSNKELELAEVSWKDGGVRYLEDVRCNEKNLTNHANTIIRSLQINDNPCLLETCRNFGNFFPSNKSPTDHREPRSPKGEKRVDGHNTGQNQKRVPLGQGKRVLH